MQKVGPYLLLGILAFALVFALLPSGPDTAAKTGATLQDVQLTLYPARDPDAVWQFRAATVTHDPIASTTALSGLQGGERLLRQKDAAGQYTGQTVLDATLKTGSLSIDGQDNILTDQATLHLVKECADVALTGTPQQPVRIDQGVGFSAPKTTLTAPDMNVKVDNLQMDFQFNILSAGRMQYEGNLDGKQACVNGKTVART